MFCSKCGTQLRDDARFCKDCGTPTPASKGAPRQTARPGRVAPSGQNPLREDPAGRTRAVLLSVGILLLIAAAYMLATSGNSGNPNPAPSAAQGSPQSGISAIDRLDSELDIHGKITLAPGVKAPGTGLLYVMARPGATPDQRAPLAVERVTPQEGETAFVIGPDNIMTGGDFNQPVVITVRWDQDRDPLTKQIGDLTGATQGPIKPGTKGVAVVLGQTLQKAELHPTLVQDGAAPGAPAMDSASAPAGEGASAPAPESASAPAAPSEGKKITGRIVLADGVKAPGDGVVFVIARPAGQTAGPPAAAARFTPGAQGLTYTLGPENMMMGGNWGGPYDISASWDQDGNATSKQPGDLSGRAKKPAKAGDSVDVVLDTVR